MKFISVDFLNQPIPQEFRWTTKYFRSDIKKAFLQYFITFGVSHRFCEHTGYCCTLRYLKRMRKRFNQLKIANKKAREDLDFEMVAKIEMGYFFRKRR